MSDIEVEILNVANATASGAGSNAATIGSRENKAADAAFFLNVTSLTGTAPTMDVTIKKTVDGIDYTLGTFTQATGATSERIVITNCPDVVRAEYTAGGTVTDFDGTVTSIRL